MNRKWIAMLLMIGMVVAVLPVNTQGASKSTENRQGSNFSNVWRVDGYYPKGCGVGNTLYYNVYNKLYKMNIKTGKKKLLYSYDCFSIDSIQYFNEKLYVVINKFAGTGGSHPYITRINSDGTGYKVLDVGSNVSIAGKKLYYIKQTELLDFETFDPVGIYMMNLNGKGSKCIIKNDILTLAVCDGKKIYYSTLLGSYQTNLKGKSRKKLANKGEEMIGVYKNEVYYSISGEDMTEVELYQRNIKSARVRKIDSDIAIFSAKVDREGGSLYYIKSGENAEDTELIKWNTKTLQKQTISRQKNLSSISVFGKYMMYSFNERSQSQSKYYHFKTKKRKHLAKYYIS
ncbi:MAG: DUF5050 domain-containing protein [Lachnoclostridium sp.]|jgi:hypothetical protein|nr:DUF5050 domain-containing protein [Lachnoclostridium sp.]